MSLMTASILAAVTLGQEDSVFVSNVRALSIWTRKEEPVGGLRRLGRAGAWPSASRAGRLVTVSDTCLTFADADGKMHGNLSATAASYLREYDLDGDGFAALLLNRYQSGSVGTPGDRGRRTAQEIASLDVHEEVLGISAAGRYLAVLYTDRLVIYNQELQEYAALDGHGLRPGRADAAGRLGAAAGRGVAPACSCHKRETLTG